MNRWHFNRPLNIWWENYLCTNVLRFSVENDNNIMKGKKGKKSKSRNAMVRFLTLRIHKSKQQFNCFWFDHERCTPSVHFDWFISTHEQQINRINRNVKVWDEWQNLNSNCVFNFIHFPIFMFRWKWLEVESYTLQHTHNSNDLSYAFPQSLFSKEER